VNIRSAQELGGARRGLIAVHTLPCATRLLPIYEMLADCNPRMLWSFTVPPDDYNHGVATFLRNRGLKVLKWKRLVNELQLHFGVALAAAWGGLHKLQMPVIKMAHGARYEKKTPRRPGSGAETPRLRHGLGVESMVWHARTVASRVVVAHKDDIAALDPTVAGLIESARVMGDPIVDQIDGHLHLRERYREDLELEPGMKLIVVTSTAGRRCLWLDRPELLHRLVTELPAQQYRIVAILHPHLRHVYGTQLDIALRRLLARGLRLVPPDQDWMVPVIAADWVLGDHGSVLQYATRTPAVLLKSGFATDEIATGSARARLGEQVPALVWNQPIEPQLLAAARPEVVARYASAAQQLSSQPGRFAANLRREIHHLLGVAEPEVPARLPDLVVPKLITG
jgi:hypothetical protein